jgi:DinB superfamily
MNPYQKKLGNRDPYKVASATHGRIRSMISKLSSGQLSRRPAPGKWSIQEIIRHLTDTEMVISCRSRWIASEDNPKLLPFDQDKWAQCALREKESIAECLERFRLLRRSHLRLFQNAPGKDLKRIGYHPQRGVMTLKMQLEMIAGHDLNHLDQIARIAGSFRHRQARPAP